MEQNFRWNGLVEAGWWLRAHTKDNKWTVPADVREEWAASINTRTPLSPRDLLEGAVDMDWFWSVYKALGDARWQTVYKAAKYSSSGIGHARAKQFADAMLGTRGWIAHPDYGVQKTFHRQELSAHVSFLGGYFNPAEVEGLTIEGVFFTRTDQWKPVPLPELPPILFSEVMRDLDLVVSVAHRGGVDPETTAATVEMCTTLLR